MTKGRGSDPLRFGVHASARSSDRLKPGHPASGAPFWTSPSYFPFLLSGSPPWLARHARRFSSI